MRTVEFWEEVQKDTGFITKKRRRWYLLRRLETKTTFAHYRSF